MAKAGKPLGGPAYGSIGHLPNSRLGPADHCIPQGQADICTKDAKGRLIVVQEKMDGSCVSVARIGKELVPLTRAGYHARTSRYEQHHLFADWVESNIRTFDLLLMDDERVVGEWIAQAHGTRYFNAEFPFYAFDIFKGNVRIPFTIAGSRLYKVLPQPRLISAGPAMSVAMAMKLLSMAPSAGCEKPEGVVYRAESNGKVEFLAKWVDPDKVDGKYLPEVSGQEAVWNWRPHALSVTP